MLDRSKWEGASLMQLRAAQEQLAASCVEALGRDGMVEPEAHELMDAFLCAGRSAWRLVAPNVFAVETQELLEAFEDFSRYVTRREAAEYSRQMTRA